jgi:hypothetical protein
MRTLFEHIQRLKLEPTGGTSALLQVAPALKMPLVVQDRKMNS